MENWSSVMSCFCSIQNGCCCWWSVSGVELPCAFLSQVVLRTKPYRTQKPGHSRLCQWDHRWHRNSLWLRWLSLSLQCLLHHFSGLMHCVGLCWSSDFCLLVCSGWRQRPAFVDCERRSDWSRPLQRDHLLGGLLQPARGRVCQRYRRRAWEWRGQVSPDAFGKI